MSAKDVLLPRVLLTEKIENVLEIYFQILHLAIYSQELIIPTRVLST